VTLDAVLEMAKRTAGGAVDADAPLIDAGIDSLGAVELRNQLKAAAGQEVMMPSTLIFDYPTFDYPTARQLATLLAPVAAEEEADDWDTDAPCCGLMPASVNVAVDGTSAVFPAGAGTLKAASIMVATGSDVIGEVPLSRWDVNAAHAGLPDAVAKKACFLGSVQGAQLIDNAVFAVSPSEAAAMDPCQRLLLEHGYRALHEGSADRSTLSGSLTGFFLGFAVTEFGQVLLSSPAGGSVYAATGFAASIAAGRLSFTLGLNGPCVTIDTACSAALAACHSGLRALQRSECTTGLVAATTLMLAPGVGVSFAVAGMLSATGRSHTFDTRANGYARGEGCGAISMSATDIKELGVTGSAVRQDGRSASLTAPNGQAQQALLGAAWGDAAITSDDLTLSEAHGTGTALGDPIEAGSLVIAAVLASVDSEFPLVLGGVKANIGHAEPCAGMTGLLKLAFGMQLRKGAPNPQLRVLNPHVRGSLMSGSVGPPVQQTQLITEANAGGVSSFGYSGTIVHTVLHHSVHDSTMTATSAPSVLEYRRQAFPWVDPPHPFAQREVWISDETYALRSPAEGALHAMVADHVVHGGVVFPGTGYLELARAAATGRTAPHSVYFLQPLAVETPGLVIDCTVGNGRFEVRSAESEDGLADGATVHCSGKLVAAKRPQRIDQALARLCAHASSVDGLYDSFETKKLQYGPSFRTLTQAWAGTASAAARLQKRTAYGGTVVHPADLDDTLCTGALTSSSADGNVTRLPFAVDDALLVAARGALWAVRCACDRRTKSPSPFMMCSLVVHLLAECNTAGSRVPVAPARHPDGRAAGTARRLPDTCPAWRHGATPGTKALVRHPVGSAGGRGCRQPGGAAARRLHSDWPFAGGLEAQDAGGDRSCVPAESVR